MCVILCCEKERPSFSLLKAAAIANSDGAGVAWAAGGSVHWRKWLTVPQLYRLVGDESDIEFPFIVHFRLSTVGGAQPLLCHPFTISAESSLSASGQTKQPVLFHNGHWGKWESALNEFGPLQGPVSDSRVLAVAVSHVGESLLEPLAAYNKFAIMEPDGAVKLLGNWTQRHGISFSNLSFGYAQY